MEQAASEEVGESVSVGGLRFGAGNLRKLTVGFIDQHGLSAIAKFPLTDGAAESLTNEVEAINSLSGFRRLSGHLPDLIGSIDLGKVRGALFSAGPIGRVRRPGIQVISFLSTLSELTARRSTIHVSGVVDSWLEGLETRRALLGPKRLSILEHAIGSVLKGMDQVPIDHTVAHGDFTRWNVRRGANGLFVFDWEASFRVALPYHDLFHYFSAESALLRRPSPTSHLRWKRIRSIAGSISSEWIPFQRELYLAYLIKTTLWYARVRDWDSRDKPGPFWRFLWAELTRAH